MVPLLGQLGWGGGFIGVISFALVHLNGFIFLTDFFLFCSHKHFLLVFVYRKCSDISLWKKTKTFNFISLLLDAKNGSDYLKQTSETDLCSLRFALKRKKYRYKRNRRTVKGLYLDYTVSTLCGAPYVRSVHWRERALLRQGKGLLNSAPQSTESSNVCFLAYIQSWG
jgi:hypothetical protein